MPDNDPPRPPPRGRLRRHCPAQFSLWSGAGTTAWRAVAGICNLSTPLCDRPLQAQHGVGRTDRPAFAWLHQV